MKPGLLILPFVALFVGAIGTLFAKANSQIPYLIWIVWGIAAAIVGAWVALDIENFKALFKRSASFSAVRKELSRASVAFLRSVNSLKMFSVCKERGPIRV